MIIIHIIGATDYGESCDIGFPLETACNVPAS